MYASNRDIGSITTPYSTLEMFVTTRKIAGAITLEVERWLFLVQEGKAGMRDRKNKTPLPAQDPPHLFHDRRHLLTIDIVEQKDRNNEIELLVIQP